MEPVADLDVNFAGIIPVEAAERLAVVKIHAAIGDIQSMQRCGELVAEILAQRGIEGLYTSTLFRYNEKVFEKLGPALELGRSFVRPEYQRQYAPDVVAVARPHSFVWVPGLTL